MDQWNKMNSDFTVDVQATKQYRRQSGTALAGVAIAMGVLGDLLTAVRAKDEQAKPITKAKKRWKRAMNGFQVEKTRSLLEAMEK